MTGVRVVRVSSPAGELLEPDWLSRAESVHRQLRPDLAVDYPAQMRRILAGGGEMAVAVDGDVVRCVTVFRSFENTHLGRRFYVDDLVTDEAARSTGAGATMLRWLEAEALSRGCRSIDLESGVHRSGAHRFYFREGFSIPSYSFRKPIR
jgi:GNAT superfamily N-acetyltransferase